MPLARIGRHYTNYSRPRQLLLLGFGDSVAPYFIFFKAVPRLLTALASVLCSDDFTKVFRRAFVIVSKVKVNGV